MYSTIRISIFPFEPTDLLCCLPRYDALNTMATLPV